MLTLPASTRVRRNKEAEDGLVAKARAWIEGEERTPGIHASGILDPRLAFFQATAPKTLPDRLVNTFLVGKVLHAFVISAVTGVPSDLSKTDEGSSYSDSLGLSFSPDLYRSGKVRELKTSRRFSSAKEGTPIEDLDGYLQQLLVYMAATGTTSSQLWILYLNERDESGRTAPAFRAFDFSVSAEDLEAAKREIKETKDKLENAIQTGDFRTLPLCTEWKCGARNCQWYGECKPEGRFGLKEFDEVQGRKKAPYKRSK